MSKKQAAWAATVRFLEENNCALMDGRNKEEVSPQQWSFEKRALVNAVGTRR